MLVSYSDYYPGGMLMPGRFESVDEQRHLFNGMEADGEVSGEGNSYTTQFRQYDPRLGRWKSLDPLMAMFPNMSPYVGFANNPVVYTDPYGLAPEEGGDGGGDSSYETEEATVYGEDKYKGLEARGPKEIDNGEPKGKLYSTPAKNDDAVAEQGNVFVHNSAQHLDFNEEGQLTSFVDGQFIYKWDSEKEWYYDNYYNKRYDDEIITREEMYPGITEYENSPWYIQMLLSNPKVTGGLGAEAFLFGGGLSKGLKWAAPLISGGADFTSQAIFKGGVSEVNMIQTFGATLGGRFRGGAFVGSAFGATVDWRPFSKNPLYRNLDFAWSKGQSTNQILFNFGVTFGFNQLGRFSQPLLIERGTTIFFTNFMGEGVSGLSNEDGPVK